MQGSKLDFLVTLLYTIIYCILYHEDCYDYDYTNKNIKTQPLFGIPILPVTRCIRSCAAVGLESEKSNARHRASSEIRVQEPQGTKS